MANLPYDPFTAPSPAVGQNSDLPAANFPQLRRINPTELVGPEVANRQVAALEKRTEYLRQYLSRIAAMLNEIDNTFVRKDGTVAKDLTRGMQADLLMNLHKIVDLAAGEISVASVEAINGGQLYAAIMSLASDAGFSIVRDTSTGLLKLKGDVAGPGPSRYYGTNASGVLGWWPLPVADVTHTPNQQLLHLPLGVSTWLVPTGVTELWAGVRGADGGYGEAGNAISAGGVGGLGGLAFGKMTVTPGELVEIIVGGGGGNGYGGTWAGAGGGGGGGSRVRVPSSGDSIVSGGGGGGGGGGEAYDSQVGFPGGAGGQRGGMGYGGSVGGAAGGGGITEFAGVGGAGGAAFGGNGHPGGVGATALLGGTTGGVDYLFNPADTTPPVVAFTAANGVVSLRWYQP